MRALLSLLLLCAAASAQVAFTFVEQPSRIPGVKEYRVWVRNDTSQPTEVLGAQVVAVADARQPPVNVITPVNLRQIIDQANRRSAAHWIIVVAENVGAAGSIVDAAGGFKIKEARYRAIIPAGAAGLRLARDLVEREWKPVDMPTDVMQGKFIVPANGSIDFAVFAPL